MGAPLPAEGGNWPHKARRNWFESRRPAPPAAVMQPHACIWHRRLAVRPHPFASRELRRQARGGQGLQVEREVGCELPQLTCPLSVALGDERVIRAAKIEVYAGTGPFMGKYAVPLDEVTALGYESLAAAAAQRGVDLCLFHAPRALTAVDPLSNAVFVLQVVTDLPKSLADAVCGLGALCPIRNADVGGEVPQHLAVGVVPGDVAALRAGEASLIIDWFLRSARERHWTRGGKRPGSLLAAQEAHAEALPRGGLRRARPGRVPSPRSLGQGHDRPRPRQRRRLAPPLARLRTLMLSNGAHDQRVQGYASGGSLSPKETLIDFHPDATGAADDGFAAALDTRVVCSWIWRALRGGRAGGRPRLQAGGHRSQWRRHHDHRAAGGGSRIQGQACRRAAALSAHRLRRGEGARHPCDGTCVHVPSCLSCYH